MGFLGFYNVTFFLQDRCTVDEIYFKINDLVKGVCLSLLMFAIDERSLLANIYIL